MDPELNWELVERCQDGEMLSRLQVKDELKHFGLGVKGSFSKANIERSAIVQGAL